GSQVKRFQPWNGRWMPLGATISSSQSPKAARPQQCAMGSLGLRPLAHFDGTSGAQLIATAPSTPSWISALIREFPCWGWLAQYGGIEGQPRLAMAERLDRVVQRQAT